MQSKSCKVNFKLFVVKIPADPTTNMLTGLVMHGAVQQP